MPGDTKNISRQQAARTKAQTQRVYISGLKGHHSLETGVVYHYRGHFIYTYPSATPIEPIPYSTRNGISLIGATRDRAPIHDPKATDLVAESDIAVLQRARIQEQEHQQQQEESRRRDTTLMVPQSFTPHGRAQFFACSAPGSRHVFVTGTPHTSRPVSPTHGLQVRGSLRPIASTSRLNQLLAEEGFRGANSLLRDVAERTTSRAPADLVENELVTNLPTEYIDPKDIAAFIETVSRPPSRPLPRTSRTWPTEDQTMNTHAYFPSGTNIQAPRPASRMQNQSVRAAYRSADHSLHLRALGHRGVIRPASSRMSSPSLLVADNVSDNSLSLCSRCQVEIPLQQSGVIDMPSLSTIQKSMDHNSTLPSLYWPLDKPLGARRPRNASMTPNQINNAARPHRQVHYMPKVEQIGKTNDPYAARSLSTTSSFGDMDVPADAISMRTSKCSIHGEGCDGVTTTNKNLTEQALEFTGFQETYPVIECADGRVMIDWQKMLGEEQARRKS
ncbi:hypothetical protein BKA66DRAFT_587485 [Pyrenochaeta sp. MPI-SDFR-AT-0127]|nr:hypothetical protein BKA66DRAFT_587485 [Pyrenochaeta sp. MPI-SDFR-AT-0127]